MSTISAETGLRIEHRPYATLESTELMATLYSPDGPPRAAVVDIHGGAWTQGDRSGNKVIAEALAKRGILVMAPDFRMPPAVRYPVSVADIHLSVRWLKRYATGLGLPASKVGGIGTSSGGHQILLAALKPFDSRYAAAELVGEGGAGVDATLAYLVVCWPVSDPLARYHFAVENKLPMVASHDAYWQDVAAMEEGNPTLMLERGDAVSLPPTLVIQGTADENLTPDMSDRFVAAYRKRGGDIRLETFPGQKHAFVTRSADAAESAVATGMIRDFILARAGA